MTRTQFEYSIVLMWHLKHNTSSVLLGYYYAMLDCKAALEIIDDIYFLWNLATKRRWNES